MNIERIHNHPVRIDGVEHFASTCYLDPTKVRVPLYFIHFPKKIFLLFGRGSSSPMEILAERWLFSSQEKTEETNLKTKITLNHFPPFPLTAAGSRISSYHVSLILP
jgi:hypothetical protein